MFSRLFCSPASTQAPSGPSCMVENLERRQLLASSPVFIITDKIKVRNLFDDDGISRNQSALTVRFSDNINIVNPAGIRMIGYVVNPVGGAQRKVTVNLSEIQRDPTFNNFIYFKTDSLSPRSGRIIIDPGAVTDSQGREVTANVQPPRGQNKERFTLARRAFRPTDVSLFPQSVEPTGNNGTARPTDVPAATVTEALTVFMRRKRDAGLITEAQRQQALDLYNSNLVKQVIPNANLRAAFASLVGTVGEPAIDAIINGENPTGARYTIIDFSSEARPGAVVAETLLNPTTNRLRTLFKEQYRGEPFQALAGYIAHETVHQDNVAGQNEEIFANVVETMVYAQHMEDRTIRGWIFSQSLLTQDGNAKLLAMLNSGTRVFPRVGITEAINLNPGNKVFWRSTTANDQSFEEYVRRLYTERNFNDTNTPGNETARRMYVAMTGRNTSSITFDRSRLELIDTFQTVITDKKAIQIAGLLGLTNWIP